MTQSRQEVVASEVGAGCGIRGGCLSSALLLERFKAVLSVMHASLWHNAVGLSPLVSLSSHSPFLPKSSAVGIALHCHRMASSGSTQPLRCVTWSLSVSIFPTPLACPGGHDWKKKTGEVAVACSNFQPWCHYPEGTAGVRERPAGKGRRPVWVHCPRRWCVWALVTSSCLTGVVGSIFFLSFSLSLALFLSFPLSLPSFPPSVWGGSPGSRLC